MQLIPILCSQRCNIMKNIVKYTKYTLLSGIAALTFANVPITYAQNPGTYIPQPHHNPGYVPYAAVPQMPTAYINPQAYHQAPLPRPRQPHTNYGPKYPVPAFKNLSHHLDGRKKLAYQVPARLPSTGHFQRWVDYEPEYRLYPGDQLDIVVSSAPEMSRTLTIGPDGRVAMPHIKPTMAAGRTFTELQQSLETQLATVLRDPKLAVTPRTYAPEQIYIGGQVGQQGTYTLSGPTGVLEAIIMSGGLTAGAKSGTIAVLRRAPNGGMMMRTINLKNGLKNIREYDDNMQLHRNDIIFVPRNRLAEIGAWMAGVRNALPLNLTYQIGGNNNGFGGLNGNFGP